MKITRRNMLAVVALTYQHIFSPLPSQYLVSSARIDLQHSQHEDTRYGKLLPLG